MLLCHLICILFVKYTIILQWWFDLKWPNLIPSCLHHIWPAHFHFIFAITHAMSRLLTIFGVSYPVVERDAQHGIQSVYFSLLSESWQGLFAISTCRKFFFWEWSKMYLVVGDSELKWWSIHYCKSPNFIETCIMNKSLQRLLLYQVQCRCYK